MTSKMLRLFQPESGNSKRGIPILQPAEVAYLIKPDETLLLRTMVCDVRECLEKTIKSISRAATRFETTRYASKIRRAAEILGALYSTAYDSRFDPDVQLCVENARDRLLLNLTGCYQSLGLLFMASKEHWEAKEDFMGVMHNALEGVVATIKLIQQGTHSSQRCTEYSTNAVLCVRRTRNALLNACLVSKPPENTEANMRCFAAFRISLMLSNIISSDELFARYNVDVVTCATFYMKAALEELNKCKGPDERGRIFDEFFSTVSVVTCLHHDAMQKCSDGELYLPARRGRLDPKTSILLNIFEAATLLTSFFSLHLAIERKGSRDLRIHSRVQKILRNVISAYKTLNKHADPNTCRNKLTELLLDGAYIKLKETLGSHFISHEDEKQLEIILITLRRAVDKINPDFPLHPNNWDSKISDLHLLPGEFPSDDRELTLSHGVPDFEIRQPSRSTIFDAILKTIRRCLTYIASSVTKLWNYIKERCRALWTASHTGTEHIRHDSAMEEQALLTDSPVMTSVPMTEKRIKKRPDLVTVEADVHAEETEDDKICPTPFQNRTGEALSLHSSQKIDSTQRDKVAQTPGYQSYELLTEQEGATTSNIQEQLVSVATCEEPGPTVTAVTIAEPASVMQKIL